MTANILVALFRVISRFFSKIFRGTGSVSRTAGKSGSELAAQKVGSVDNKPEDSLPEREGGGFESLLFTQLSRPRLSERSASDLSLEEARRHLQQADMFYTLPFGLFARSDFFYEEVEEEYLNTALGLEAGSIDERFLNIMTMFRRTLNDNTRRLMVWFAPFILVLTLVLGAFTTESITQYLHRLFTNWNVQFLDPGLLGIITAYAATGFLGFILAFLLFSWPFKVSQQRNLLNLDNYLTSKFARINNNFQVAKRRALNVERNKRMAQAEELKEEAGVWTLSYQWFGMRLLLCELMIRNRLYQVRRNTILYWLAGIILCIFVAGTIAISISVFQPTMFMSPLGITIATLVYIILSYSIFQRTTGMFFAVLEANEWSRFHLLDLHKTIQDHVGEDKVQIVTFRDRNRIE